MASIQQIAPRLRNGAERFFNERGDASGAVDHLSWRGHRGDHDRPPNGIDPPPPEQQQTRLAVDELHIAHAINGDLRVVPEIPQFRFVHGRLPTKRRYGAPWRHSELSRHGCVLGAYHLWITL